jgi:hypothetical protein
MKQDGYFVHLPKHVKQLSVEDLRQYFKVGEADKNKFTNAFLMRSIIMNEKEHLEVDYNRSLRELWYSTVKPTLDKLGLLSDDDQTEEGLTKWDATLSKYVAELVRGGYLTYQDLRITDTSRQKENPADYYRTVDVGVFGYQLTVSPYSNIVIVVEKDTVYQVVRDLAQLFGCSCISAKGQSAFAAAEYLLRGMRGDFSTVYVVAFTDYDPAGFIIADAIGKQIADMAKALGKDYKVKSRRIGLLPSQLDENTCESNMYSPKGANGHPQKAVETMFDNWFDSTNGVFGKRKGLETEALPREDLRRIFVDELLGLGIIDTTLYEKFVKKSFCDNHVLKAMSDSVRRIKDSVFDEFEVDIEVSSDFDVRRYAIKGLDAIPVMSACAFTSREKKRDLYFDTKSRFKGKDDTSMTIEKSKDILFRWCRAINKLKYNNEEVVELIKDIDYELLLDTELFIDFDEDSEEDNNYDES